MLQPTDRSTRTRRQNSLGLWLDPTDRRQFLPLSGSHGPYLATSVHGSARRPQRTSTGMQRIISAGTGAQDGGTPRNWPGDDAIVAQYLGDKRIERCRPIVEANRSLGGTAESVVREGDDVASDIIALAAEVGVDVIVVGSHGGGKFQGLLGSTGAKIVRRAACPVLVIR